MGRNKKYHTDEERKQAIKERKRVYMAEKLWHCYVCDKDFTLGAKWMHIKTISHIHNATLWELKNDDQFNIINADDNIE